MVHRVGQFLWCKYSHSCPFNLRQLTVELGDVQLGLVEADCSTPPWGQGAEVSTAEGLRTQT